MAQSSPFAGAAVHLVGIKGTGMTALAEVLSARGARVTGSDTPEKFYTDRILSQLGLSWSERFDPSNIPADAAYVIHSAAYDRAVNPELAAAAARSIPLLTYPEALGLLSQTADSSGVSGVHGKSTTTAMCGLIIKAWGLPATVVTGTEVPGFGGRASLTQGDGILVAETCEYRRHFLSFHPCRIVLTSVEEDHLDYFKDFQDIMSAFVEYTLSLPAGGSLVFCADDPGASEAAARAAARRPDIALTPYGRTAQGPFSVSVDEERAGESRFTLSGFPGAFTLRVPGAHNVLNAAAALALCSLIWRAWKPGVEPDMEAARTALRGFTGSRRRAEIVGETGGILFLDDYAHHPTAVDKTLAGFKAFYPGRRLVVDFMSHTYSRTKALLSEFGAAFGSADLVILHKIYASAREREKTVSGQDLAAEVSRHHPRVRYFEEPMEALPFLSSELRPGDVFVTMGAGDNWRLGRALLQQKGGAA